MTGEGRTLGKALAATVVISLAAGGGSAIASYRLSEQSRRESEQKMCEVLKLSTDNGRAQLDAYDRKPPSTPAGKEQRAQLQKGFNAVNRLAQSYGCAAAK